MKTPTSITEARAALKSAKAIAVLSGAGLSAASGIPTFRGQGGLWRHYRAEDLANPEAYARDPMLVWEWYAMRIALVQAAEINEAHRLLAQLGQEKRVGIVTQNVDGLHQRSGSQQVLELHGNITQSRCEQCQHLDHLHHPFELPPYCTACGSRARPNVVWFGEHLPAAVFEAALDSFARCDVALVIGTSGVVEPAASLARLAKQAGAYVITLNPEPTPLGVLADSWLQDTAERGLAALLNS